MSGIWELFRSDLRRATSRVMSVIVLCGLVVIPSAFTWFNVVGSWEPFDNTKNLKVAVASVDKGYTGALIPLHVNVGSMVESALRANDQLDWIITSKEDAVAGTESGEYYAAMVLPEDFSEKMLTFYTDGSERTHVDYYTNDKSNPLAPVITSEGADDLTAQINAEFTEELSDIALSLVSGLATSLGDADSEAALTRVEAHISDLGVQLRAASGTAEMFTALLEGSVPLAQGAGNLLDAVDSQFSAATGTVQEGATAAQQAEAAVGRASQALTAAFEASKAQLDRFEADVDRIFSGIDTDAAASVELIDSMVADLDALIGDQEALRQRLVDEVRPSIPEDELPAFDEMVTILDGAIEQERALDGRLQETSAGITSGNADVQRYREDIESRISEALDSFANANAVYANDLRPTLDQLAATLGSVAVAMGEVGGDVAGAGASVDDVVTVLQNAAADNRNLAELLASAADDVDLVVDTLSTAIDTGDFSQIGEIIGANPSVLAAAIAQPIGLERIEVYPVVSFGAGMAPLYTILSLWVGSLLLAVTLRVDPPSRPFDGGPELSLNQRFLGRYALFALMGFAQSTLVFLGNILLVGLDPVHPFLFLLTGWMTSLVFTFIVYTLVVSFSDAGKALAVFILVIQVAGAGGAYPLALLPEWFQNVSPFLPATHAIDAFRAALAGIYHADYWVSLGWLLAFLLPMLLLGLVLRKPLVGVNESMDRALKSTRLM
ncbi:YhgE/Pip domain-containing protein [Microbacterium sp. SSW1-59]|uniref:YhgE/Pip domain-containing protein n=1 Tax=Microbacterium xanthum TaxID=3079794 RepID=UPI002AD23878|nr:YhgE/Pip domain-containing protein [Microbacterium sp. SSW1-59]MDZ8200430.1 YhgE/Pip domain-containing protein [Microbacterium sp. SSW1-59]